MTFWASRNGFVMLAVLAVLLRALVPAGFMPEFDHGKMAITICHGADIKTIWVDQAPMEGKEKKADKSCPFAPVAQNNTALPPFNDAFIGAVEYTQLVYIRTEQVANYQYTHQPGQSRAPPIIL